MEVWFPAAARVKRGVVVMDAVTPTVGAHGEIALKTAAAVSTSTHRSASGACGLVVSASGPQPASECDSQDGGESDQHAGLVVLELVVDGIDVVAREVAYATPHGCPDDSAQGVEGQESPPWHVDDPGDDPVELAEAVDEAG